MELDEWNPDGEQRVAQSNARMRERGRIEEDQCSLIIPSGMYAANQIRFRVELEVYTRVPERLGAVLERIFDRSEGGGAVDTRLARAEQPEIRPIQQEQSRHPHRLETR